MRRVSALALLLAAALLPGCGGGDGSEAREALAETARKLGEIRSGELDFALLVDPREGEEFGFEVRGPFALPERAGALPRMRVEYTQIASGRRATVTLVSDGREAYAEADGRRIELSPEQVAGLRSASKGLAAGGGLRELRLDDWLRDPELSDGDEVGGEETDRIEGELDPVAVANGLLSLSSGAGGRPSRLTGRSADQLREAVKRSSFELLTGAEDRLLRRLTLDAELDLDVPEELRQALGEVVGATVSFRLGVSRPNQPVQLEAGT